MRVDISLKNPGSSPVLDETSPASVSHSVSISVHGLLAILVHKLACNQYACCCDDRKPAVILLWRKHRFDAIDQ